MTQTPGSNNPRENQPAPASPLPSSPFLAPLPSTSAPISALAPVPLASGNSTQQSRREIDPEIYGKLQALSTQEQKDIVVKLLAPLSLEEKNEILRVAGSRLLSQDATDFVWKAVISGAVIVFVISAMGIVIAAFIGSNVAPLITVFTAVVAFLGGLLAPSPIQSAVQSLSSGIKGMRGSSKSEGQ